MKPIFEPPTRRGTVSASGSPIVDGDEGGGGDGGDGDGEAMPPDPPTPPTPISGSRQLIGYSVAVSSPSWNGSGSLSNEEDRLASLFDWPNGGPPVQRLYRKQQNPPFGDMTRCINDGRIPWVSIKPGSAGPVGDIAGGSNARFDAWGEYCRDFWPSTIIFTYDHETDRHAYSGNANYSNAQYINYQTDFVTAFRHCIDRMRATDGTHSLDNVHFATNATGWAFRKGSNRDPGLMWHPDFDIVSVDPYDFYLFNNGNTASGGRRELFENYGGFSTGALEHYTFCTDPEKWYDDMHPSWDVPATILSNLDKFPVRMAIGETGFQFEMQPNASNTLWIAQEDPDSTSNAQALQLTQMAADLRDDYQRYEVVIYWGSSTNAIGAAKGSPNYFAGPTSNRWGANWPGSVEAFRVETAKANHTGTLTPWGPSGLL